MKGLGFRLLALWLASAGTSPAYAQSAKASPAAIEQMVDAVLRALVAPDSSLSRIPVSKREIAFDRERTLASFGCSGATQRANADLHLGAAVVDGSSTMLSDCKQSAPGPCAALGWKAYVWLEPISIGASEARVRVIVMWPDRGNARFDDRVPPTAHAFLVGFAADVRLVKDSSGSWKFSRVDKTIAG